MVNWKLWSGSPEDWDLLIQNFENYSIYQCCAWGAHRSNFGWAPMRLAAYKDGKVLAMTQILVKKYPLNIAVVWIPGGPVGDIDLWGCDLQSFINSTVGSKYIYCRINSMLENSVRFESKLFSSGWRRSKYPLLSGQTLMYMPSINEDDRKKICSRNWRHNLRRSFKRSFVTYVWNYPNSHEIMLAYDAMQKHKKLSAQTNYLEIESLISKLKGQCILVRCDGENGEMLAIRGALVLGERAWDIFAVATPAGRKVYASHSAFWELMKYCADRNVKWYDMGGVDPTNNPGVFDFKKGTGAQELNYLGEWEYANPPYFRYIASRIIGMCFST